MPRASDDADIRLGLHDSPCPPESPLNGPLFSYHLKLRRKKRIADRARPHRRGTITYVNYDAAIGPAELLRPVFYWLKLAAMTLISAELLTAAGRGWLGFLSVDLRDPLRRFGFGFLAGLSCAALTLLGLALTGLFYPWTILPACLALPAAAGKAGWRDLAVFTALKQTGRLGPFGLTVLGIALAPLAYCLLTPASHIDVFIYHLATPWHYLMNHRAVLVQVPSASHLPLPVELVYALPLILGDDRLALWLNLSCFAAACSLFLDRSLKRGAPGAAWLGPLLVLGTGYTLMVLSYPKNDIAAASFFVAAAFAFRHGARMLGISLLGMCVAAKPAYAPLAFAWIVFNPFEFGKMAAGVLLASVWIAPWLAKEYLVTGNPFYPFASSIFPSLNWGNMNDILVRRLSAAFLHQETYDAAALIPAWAVQMGRDYLPVLLALPALVLFSRWRRATAALVLGQIGILGMAHHARYMLPANWFLSLVIAEEVYRLRGKWRLAASGLLAGFALFSMVLAKDNYALDWREIFLSPARLQAKRLSTYFETLWVLNELKPDRVLNIGERRSYLFPGRVIYGGTRGETPLIWKLVKESDGLNRLRLKFRQLGARYMAYNYVSAEWLAQLYSPYTWSPRMLRIYAEFCKRHCVPMTHNSRCDFNNGGFYVYEILRKPMIPAPDAAWFLPGTEGLFGNCIKLENQGRKTDVLAAAKALISVLGDVGHVWNQVGHAYAILNDSPNAFKYLARFYKLGMMDQLNIPEYGAIAVRMGNLEEAEAVLQESKWRYPDQIDTIHVNEALLRGRRAYGTILNKDYAGTKNHLDAADELLALVPESTPNPPLNRARRATLGALTALRAELLLAEGKTRDAGLLFRKASSLDPENPSRGRWRRLAARLAPPGIDLGGALGPTKR